MYVFLLVVCCFVCVCVCFVSPKHHRSDERHRLSIFVPKALGATLSSAIVASLCVVPFWHTSSTPSFGFNFAFGIFGRTHTRVAGEAWRRCDAHQATRVITDQALIVAVCAAVFLAGHSSLLPSLMCVGVICVRVPWIPDWMTDTVWYCCFQTANEQTKKQATLATRMLWILLSVCLVPGAMCMRKVLTC